ncbi:MAG: hypothetical protein IT436_14465 [Phycisphaerales bacterium]|nr:hypothetical protein [Phycisphaerales bacterium]
MARRKRQQWEPGSVFLIPLPDSACAVGQVLGSEEFGGFVPVVLFGHRVASADVSLDEAIKNAVPVARSCVGKLCLDTGEWPVSGRQPIFLSTADWPNAKFRKRRSWVGAKFDNSVVLETFLKAYWGYEPWDGMKDPDYFTRFLFEPNHRPKSARLKAEF